MSSKVTLRTLQTVNVRETPSTNGVFVRSRPAGTFVESSTDKQVIANGYRWWQVADGWMAETVIYNGFPSGDSLMQIVLIKDEPCPEPEPCPEIGVVASTEQIFQETVEAQWSQVSFGNNEDWYAQIHFVTIDNETEIWTYSNKEKVTTLTISLSPDLIQEPHAK